MLGRRIAAKRSPPSDLVELVRQATGAQVVTLDQRLQALWDGYGELWRVELDGELAIVKHVQPKAESSLSHRRKLRSYAIEQTFYARYAARCTETCRVPRALALRADQGQFLTVLEDLDAAGYGERAHAPPPEAIHGALRWLAHFHATFLHVAPEGLWKVGTYWHLATRPDELASMKHSALKRAAHAIDTRLSSARFRTLVHGDAKLQNVCFATDARAAFVDFQYVGGGVGVKDVAYFLSSCLRPRDCAASVPAYLETYFEELRDAATSVGAGVAQLDELEREWRALFPFAWADFYRFWLGWAGDRPEPFSEELVSHVLGLLA